LISHKRFVLSVIAVPFFIVCSVFLFNYVVDPFNMNGVFDLGLNKQLISFKADYRLYKAIAFARQPEPNIILGDSRMAHFDAGPIQQETGQVYFNNAYGGGTAYEIIDTFWLCAGQTKLKNVVIGLNFNLFNAENKLDLVPQAKELIDDKQKYYFSSTITKISFYNVYYRLFNINLVSENPKVTKAVFWKVQLQRTSDYYGKYRYPADIVRELKKIKQYCDKNGINLVIIIPPTHVDLQRKVDDFGLRPEYVRYKHDLAGIARTIDFDYPNEWTRDYNMFTDPYHFNEKVREQILKEVWGGKLCVGREL